MCAMEERSSDDWAKKTTRDAQWTKEEFQYTDTQPAQQRVEGTMFQQWSSTAKITLLENRKKSRGRYARAKVLAAENTKGPGIPQLLVVNILVVPTYGL